ncbi:MAG: large conductance mechanosensitive channel protein MscL [Clostridia bacterium]|jgi:large conductance mechanosensitive channel|nr:large conductance mechanosensitive channel protein MscL [Clostridia bacterium]
MWKEFKKFAMRGNVIDLAVGIIIGGAFNNIVSSLVKDIITPLIGILLGKIDIKDRVWEIASVKITYGVFLQNILDFVIIAFSVFMIVKTINRLSNLRKVEEEKVEETKKISREEVLLSEIRDLLAANINKQE